MLASQQISEPVDAEFFRLFFEAVRLGIRLIRDLETRDVLFASHIPFHRAYRVEGTPMPTFLPMGLKDYGAAFYTTPKVIVWKEHLPIRDLVDYALSTDPISRHFRLAKYTLAGDNHSLSDENVAYLVIKLFAGVVDMCLHKLSNDDLSVNWFKPWYREIERGIFDKELEVDLIIPIVGLSFDFNSHWLYEQTVAIFKMNEEFQEARFLDQQFDIRVPSIVAGFSSHGFLLKNRKLANDGFLQISHQAQVLIKNEISLINSLFGLLKAATGDATGYAQVLIHPLMWAHRYLAHLPVVISEAVRAYPTSFDEGVWRKTPQVVPLHHLKSISKILSTPDTFKDKRISLALSRLNSCLLRENKEDQILDACIGLEALFNDSDKQEMTHKLALRVAAISQYFERGEYSKKDIFAAVKTIYKFRSTVAHGGKTNSKDSVVTIAGGESPTEEFAVDILRESIIALGKYPQFLDSAKIDFDILLGSSDGSR